MMLVIKILVVIFFLMMVTAAVELFTDENEHKLFFDTMSVIMSILVFMALAVFVMYVMLSEVQNGLWF